MIVRPIFTRSPSASRRRPARRSPFTHVPFCDQPSSQIVHSPARKASSACRRDASGSHGREMSASKRRPTVIESPGPSRLMIRWRPSPSRKSRNGEPRSSAAWRSSCSSGVRLPSVRGDSISQKDPTPSGARGQVGALGYRVDWSVNQQEAVTVSERLAIAGSGAIACGLAAVAATRGEVTVFARSDGSCEKASARVHSICEKLGASGNGNVRVTRDPAVLEDATFVVEAIVEDPDVKAQVWRTLADHLADDAVLATTTSSLPISGLAQASGHPERFVGLRVFNPVPKMDLVELAFPPEATDATRQRAHALCAALGKTAVEVPDTPGFVVNRLLFPYLFDAVRLMERTGLGAEAIDTCMCLGAGHPMGPLALLDLVGLDVSAAIGRTIGAEVPARITAMIEEGSLGRKAGRGFFAY